MASSWLMARSAFRVISRMRDGLLIICMDCRSTSGSSRSRAISGLRSMSSLSWGFMRIMARIVSGSLIICCTIGELMSCCIISGFCIMDCCAWDIICCMGSPLFADAGGGIPPIIDCSGFVAWSVCWAAGGLARSGLLRQCTIAPLLGSYEPTVAVSCHTRPAQTRRMWSFGRFTRPDTCSLSSSTVTDGSTSIGNSAAAAPAGAWTCLITRCAGINVGPVGRGGRGARAGEVRRPVKRGPVGVGGWSD
mmetsp:Transcript_60110/g.169536  ORF Transcript_60110/g.169536 Transcript_60110/m.169536 type:complete len:249 (-) Transcript_60110:14-760(-)